MRTTYARLAPCGTSRFDASRDTHIVQKQQKAGVCGMLHKAMLRGLLRSWPAQRVVLAHSEPLEHHPSFTPDTGARPKLEHCIRHAHRRHTTCERSACARRRRAIALSGFRGFSSMDSTMAKQLALDRHALEARSRGEVGGLLCTSGGRYGGSAAHRTSG